MKKTISSLLVLLMSLLAVSTALAASPVKSVPIFIEGDGQVKAAGRMAMQENGVWLLPAAVISEHIYANSRLDSAAKALVMKFGKARLSLPERDLERKFAYSVELSVPYQSVDKVSYVELEPAAQLSGFAWREEAEGLYLMPGAYSGFAPFTLPVSDKRLTAGEKVRLAWQPTFGEAENLAAGAVRPGLNVVSPSWFAITDGQGSVKNQASLDYVRQAHEKGYKVWPLVTNSFSPDITSKFLHNERAKQSIIRQLAYYLLVYEADGVNIDFENINSSDRVALSEFVTELCAALHSLGLNTSLDVTAPSDNSSWSLCYDRQALGAAADYIMLMAYDEHWRTSPVSGSVASMPWVERGLTATLQEVPAEKLVLGVPFYMRRWEEVNGQKTDAKTLTMAGAAEEIAARQLSPEWQEDIGQYYYEYRQNGHTYRVWQEEARSLGLKLELADKYGIAGIAAWRSGFETPDIWQLIDSRYGNQQTVAADTDKKDNKKAKKSKKKKRRHSVEQTDAVKSNK